MYMYLVEGNRQHFSKIVYKLKMIKTSSVFLLIDKGKSFLMYIVYVYVNGGFSQGGRGASPTPK